MCKQSLGFGFSLVEVLIAIFILTFGLLGITSFYIRSMQLATNNYWQEVAISQAVFMVEKQRVFEQHNFQFDSKCRDLLPHGRCENGVDKVVVSWREQPNEQYYEIKTKGSG